MILVDALVDYGDRVKGEARRYGTVWCHMVSDTSEEELHAFAQRIGMRREWFQHEETHSGVTHAHYDLTPGRRARAIAAGAVEVQKTELARRAVGWNTQTRKRLAEGC